MRLFAPSSAFARVTTLASLRTVHTAFSWLHGNPKTIMDWQAEMVGIPAPPFGERARGAWLSQRFVEMGLTQVETDAEGNVIAVLPSAKLPPESTGPVVVLSAHLDTVFPAGTPIEIARDGDQLAAPGACDNAAGVAGMLALTKSLLHAGIELPVPLVVLGNVGEEGEGNLRGVRHFYHHGKFAGRIAAHIVLDGAGADSAVTQALGSRRFQVTITGPGGHSFTDTGTPNPIMALAMAFTHLDAIRLDEESRTTSNVGTIAGGISVNSIPETAQANVDFRSVAAEQLVGLEVTLHRAVEDAVEQCNAKGRLAGRRSRGPLTFSIARIGDRPAAFLPEDSPLLGALRAVDRHLGLTTDLRLGSTDANIPLSLGIPALSMGAGGEGGAAHTVQEWYSAKNREIALKRILLLTLSMLEWAAEQ